MEKQNLGNVFYSLNIRDIQTVAKQEIKRKLSNREIEVIKDLASSNINWYEAIADAIREGIGKVTS